MGNIKLISSKGKKRISSPISSSGSGYRSNSGYSYESGSGYRSNSGTNSGTGYKSGSGSRSGSGSDYRSNSRSGASSDYRSNSRSGATSSARTSSTNARSSAKPRRKRKTGAKTALIIFIILVVGIVALILSLGFYVKNLDTVFPNVWAEGIRVSGMTLEEARQALIDEGYEDNAKDVSATVIFPDSSKFSISGEDVGLSLDANEAASTAYNYGKDGTFFEVELAYVRAMLNKTELSNLSKVTLDEEFVRNVVTENTKAFNDTLINDFFGSSNESIVIVKGTGIEPADEKAVYDLTMATLMSAMEEQKHLIAEYTPEPADVEKLNLEAVYNSIKVDPVSSKYDPATQNITESSTGLNFDLEAAQAMLENAGVGDEVVIPLVTIEPEVKKEDLEGLLFRDVLAQKTTDIAGTSNRVNNIVLSSTAINGTVLNPGDVFSFNGIVGQRTAKAGYKEAGAYVGGKVVQEIGGGICQTSSTIYDCVLRTDLEVLERAAHRYRVSYLPPGNDATINWGTLDFKFKNNTNYPIRIEAVADAHNRKLTVKLIGTKLDDTYYKTEYVLISSNPRSVVRQEDPSVSPGKEVVDTPGYDGCTVDTFKLLYDGNDKLISRTKVNRSDYKKQDKIILVAPGYGNGTPPPTPTESPTNTAVPTTSPPPTTSQPTDPPPSELPTSPSEPPVDPPPTESIIDEPSEASRQEPDEG